MSHIIFIVFVVYLLLVLVLEKKTARGALEFQDKKNQGTDSTATRWERWWVIFFNICTPPYSRLRRRWHLKSMNPCKMGHKSFMGIDLWLSHYVGRGEWWKLSKQNHWEKLKKSLPWTTEAVGHWSCDCSHTTNKTVRCRRFWIIFSNVYLDFSRVHTTE